MHLNLTNTSWEIETGEKMVPYACVQNDLEHFNGRTGMGAVMGSKNLKAIAARGHKKIEKADNLNHESYHNTIFDSTSTCSACAVHCNRRVFLKDKKYPLNKHFGGPEYETIAGFGSLCGIDNLPAVAHGNQLCNLLGLDTISTASAIAFAFECFENEILTEKDTDGHPLNWGNADAMIWLIKEIANRSGIGKILSNGVKKAAEIIGNGAEKYAFHIKGQELPLHEGRGKTGMGFALSPTGAEHMESPHDVAFQGDGVSKLHALGIFDPIEPLETNAAKVKFFATLRKAGFHETKVVNLHSNATARDLLQELMISFEIIKFT